MNKMDKNKQVFDKISDFSYTNDILAMDRTITWLENRLNMRNKPNKVPSNLIKFLKEQRTIASKAVSTKEWSWD